MKKEEVKFKISTLRVDSAARVVMGRPVQSYLVGLKAASATGQKDSDDKAVYLFEDLYDVSTETYVDSQDAACINQVLTSIGYFAPSRYDELIDAATAASSIWSQACSAADAAAKAADAAAKAAAAAKSADAAAKAADAKAAADKAAADKAAALPAKAAADKALADYMAGVPDYDPFTKDHKRAIAKYIYERDKAGKLDKPTAMRVAHDYVVAHYQDWIKHFAHYINEIPTEDQLPRDSDGELIHSRKDWRDRIRKALTNRAFKAGIGYKIDLRNGIKIKGTDEQIESIEI